MILNIVKNGTENTRIAEAVREVFPDSEVKVKEDYGMSVDIEIRLPGRAAQPGRSQRAGGLFQGL